SFFVFNMNAMCSKFYELFRIASSTRLCLLPLHIPTKMTEESGSPPSNEVVCNGADEAISRRIFPEGECSHQGKKSILKTKEFKANMKKKGKKCVECMRKETKAVNEDTSICLSCGSRLCEQHGIAHSTVMRTGDPHPLFFDEDAETVRCFSCEVVIDVSNANHIKMVINEIKSLWKGKGGKSADKATLATEENPAVLDKPEPKTEKKPPMNESMENGSGPDESKKANGTKKKRALSSERSKKGENGHVNGTSSEEMEMGRMTVPRSTAIPAKGLSNLGNTCFFNSVMQCFMHTHQLAFYLERFGRVSLLHFPKRTKPIVVNDEKVEIEEATLSIPSTATPLNASLMSFIVDFRNGRTPNPQSLFGQISNKAARFRSMAQQDAHELLRYLMDGLCSEETARYQSAIATHLGVPLKTQAKLDKAIVNKAKAYLQDAGRPLLDAVFGGRLLQTIRCSKCHHVSERYENMYDLSLPLTGTNRNGTRANGVPLATQTSSSSPANARPSKHQMKKEAAAAKRAKKGSRSLRKQSSKSEEGGEIDAKIDELRVEGEKESDDEKEKENENGVEGEEREEVKEAKEEEAESSGNEEEGGEKVVDPLDLTKVLTTMKTSLPSGQSVAACLLEFTAEEILDGSNAYECAKCCTPVNKKKEATGAAKTRVEAMKRYLIVTPPVVLTIHVKRFQQTHTGARTTARKISGHVHFPLIFDIAPFCCKNVERIAPGQTSLLYSLYGVVSHSGNMTGGHYVAYVKSREKLERTEAMLEAARAVCADVQAEPSRVPSPSSTTTSIRPEDAAKDLPPGQWYYCSDSRVSAISESKVLSEEAYLLFYERIY
ncbi:hypothetical protein PMAYCL1PPCAC_01971, partial [Pristionchus mayeri]